MKNYQITSWVHHFLEDHVQPGDICIDATMGNGNDTALLSRLVGESGRVVAFDIQQMALDNTREKMKKEGCPENYELVLDSHEAMAEYAEENTVSCITFNLGYLPGGDHTKATKGESSIRKHALMVHDRRQPHAKLQADADDLCHILKKHFICL